MCSPLVSVIIPAYNADRYIGDAIESILSQTYVNWELQVIDDASTDDTYKCALKYSDTRICVKRHFENIGISRTTNEAIQECNGKYIAFLDDDDIATTDRLELQVSFLEENPHIDVLGGNSEIIDEHGGHIFFRNTPRRNPKYIKAMLLLKNVDFLNGTTMVKKSFIDANRITYRDWCYGMQDYQFFVEASKIGQISSIDRYLLKHRVYSGNYTSYIMTAYSDERKKQYSEIRRKSLLQSGFLLSEGQYKLLDQVLLENETNRVGKEKMEELYYLFLDILSQAREMNIDYYNELVLFLKRMYTNRLYKEDLFIEYEQ